MNDEKERTAKPEMKKKSSSRVRPLFAIFWVMILVMLSGFVVSQAGRYNELRARLAQVQAYIDEEKAEMEEMNFQLQFFDSDAYIEHLARERLGMIHPDQIVFRNIAD